MERKYNIVMVFSEDGGRVLMCRRRKDPYRGLLNFVGGKIEDGETHEAAAYRELCEETSIGRSDLALRHIMDLSYPLEAFPLCEVWAGRLVREVPVRGEENELCWIGTDEDFSDVERFAGCGNIYHMMQYIRIKNLL